MRYTVIWVPAAEQELAELWINALQCQEITRAAASIDHELRTDPDAKGESRPANRRVLHVLPWEWPLK